MRLDLNKRGSLWLLTAITAAVVVSLVVAVECIPFAGQVWNAVDGCCSSYSGGGGVLDCFGENISYSEDRVAANTPSSLLRARTCSDLKSSCDQSTVANHIFSNLEYSLLVKALRSTIRNLSNLRIWKAGLGRSETSHGNCANAQLPTVVAHNNYNNINANGYRRGGTSHISAAMMTFFTTLPVSSSRRISAISDTAFQTFSSELDFFFGSPGQGKGCPNPAAILSSLKGTQGPRDPELPTLSANIWKFTSKFASLSQSLLGTNLPFKSLHPDFTHNIEQSPSKTRKHHEPSETSNSTSSSTSAATTQNQHHHHPISPKTIFDIPSTQSPPEQPRAGSTLYKYQQQTNFASVPVTSGRKELRGSCLGLIVGLVACIMWF